ncbi:MAG: hypothetical protein FWD26_04575 [Treponema sp.]|nr:hypothetical protein [Treponema sp.]
MKKKLLSLFGFAFLLTFLTCDIADFKLTPDNSSRQGEFYRTENAWVEVDFLEHAQPIAFGVSIRAAENSVTKGWGHPQGFSRSGFPGRTGVNEPLQVPRPARIPEDSVEIRSQDGRGKIAGSEDGMVFFFKEVSVNKNFKMQAEFKVISFLRAEGQAPNGQEAWGIMARDFIPQFRRGEALGDRTMDAIKNNELAQALIDSSSNNYTVPGTTGGDSNMIMVGGVKRGIRAYWRRGVTWNGTTPLSSGWTLGNGNPTIPGAMDHTNTNFYFWPREWGNYADLGDDAYLERPDFPRYVTVNPDDKDITYRLTLEKNNNGFFWTIEHPSEGVYEAGHIMEGEPRKGRVRDRTAADRFNRDLPYNPNDRDPRPRIEPIDRGSIPPYEDILKSVNQENYYVGFFAARDAVVWVNNIRYWEADIEDCDPEDPIVPSQIDATMEILTPQIYTGNNYLHIKTNVPGHLVVTQDFQQIPNSVIQNSWIRADTGSAVEHNLFVIPILPPKDGDNIFSLTFYPNKNLPDSIAYSTYEGVVLKSTETINRTFVINKKVYHGGTEPIYVSNEGLSRNSGTRENPMDLQTAILYVQPGQEIIMLDGVYMLQQTIVIPRYNDGRFGALKTLRAENRDKVALDWKWKQDPANNRPPFEPMRGRAFHVMGNYWKLEGFHIRNSPGDIKGMEIGGSNNIISWIIAYSNGDSGIQIAGMSNEPTRYWPSNNRVEYCESFNNRDPADTNADAFTAKLTVGKDNVFYRCIGHSNVDDCWDLFAKRETGPIGAVTIEECVAYHAGIMSVRQPNGTWIIRYFGNEIGNNTASRNGFKLGGEGISVKHTAINSISFRNDGSAFTSNSNPSMIVRNSISIGPSGGDLQRIDIRANSGDVADGFEVNCIAGNPGADRDRDIGFPNNITRSTSISYGAGYNSILFDVDEPEIYARSLDGFDGYQGKMFMKRKADGRPDFGNVFRPGEAGKGAGTFFD